MSKTSENLPYWSLSIDDNLKILNSSGRGLTSAEAAVRKGLIKPQHPESAFAQDVKTLLSQFKSPLQVILIVAVIISSALGEFSNSLIILGIILISGVLGFVQERKANHAIRDLRAIVRITSAIIRDGKILELPASEIVHGDLVQLKAGDIIPADCIIMESHDLHVNESTLTGESFPVEKAPGVIGVTDVLSKRSNCVFQGSSVVSGTASALVVKIGSETEFGHISASLQRHQPLTAFEDGLRHFGFMVMRATLLLSVTILVVNIYFGKPVGDSLLFALALAVGMAPELLPAIVTITLSAGASRMAKRQVVVKKLGSIQNLGAINILCSDKTGTLTEGSVKVMKTVDGRGQQSDLVRDHAYLNAFFESGFTNPLDDAIRALKKTGAPGHVKVDEIPYDFIRKRLSIVTEHEGRHLLITKGAPTNIIEICSEARFEDGSVLSINDAKKTILETHASFSEEGLRTIGICSKDITDDPFISKQDEIGMTFEGFVVLSDILKPDVAETIRELAGTGVKLKVITGDNILVARHTSLAIGLRSDDILTGSDLKLISDEALPARIRDVEVFAETEPNQKERIVRAFRKSGNVVGYLGDGINDVSALHAADVGISVDSAVDVAKEAADIVLLKKDIKVLYAGIQEGRKTFMNSLKYIFITTSANFGNMFSMAGTSLFLPFLPLLPKQILLLNLLNDIPAMTIASDNVDPETLNTPRHWNTDLIRKFMIVFGIESSLFDFITFGTLLWLFKNDVSMFQTGWFMESILTSLLTLLIMRTRRPVFQSPPNKVLLLATIAIALVSLSLPFLPFASLLGFKSPPLLLIGTMLVIVVLYAFLAEFTKQYFFRRLSY